MLLLVSTTFLVQNNYYASQVQRTAAQDNTRLATELIASEIRSTMGQGVTVAGERTLTVRSPMVLGLVCDVTGNGDVRVHTEGGQAALVTSEVAGVAIRDAATGTWSYANETWAGLDGGDASAPGNCFDNGADTIGGRSEFHRIDDLDAMFSPGPTEGDVIMLFRESTFEIKDSVLDPGRLGLFRTVYGGTAVEFATGMDTTAQFQYRVGVGPSFSDTVVAASLPTLNAVRIVAEARRPAQTGGVDDITFGWSVNIPLRNVR